MYLGLGPESTRYSEFSATENFPSSWRIFTVEAVRHSESKLWWHCSTTTNLRFGKCKNRSGFSPDPSLGAGKGVGVTSSVDSDMVFRGDE